MKLKKKPRDFVVKEMPIEFSGSGNYVIVTVTKRGLNTEDVAQLFARVFGVPRKNVGYAGAKDKRAVTTQYFSLKGVTEKKISGFSHEGIKVGVAGVHNAPLSLGDLTGNHFEIIVRELEKPLVPQKEVRNYYGEQRFGQNNVVVGRMLVKKQFVEACNELGIHASNPVEALRSLPKHTLLLYVHAYQSWLWNELLKKLKKPPASLPLIGFGTEVDGLDDDVRGLVEERLGNEGVTPRDFVIKQLPGISPEGGERATTIDVKDLVLGPFEDGVQKTSFFLPKGSYATVVVKELAQ